MRVLVCGGRDFDDMDCVQCHLDGQPISLIIHGGARGADKLASDYAFMMGIEEKCFPADWKRHGKAAGPIRNQQMMDEGRPDLVVAFPGGVGTADMVWRAKSAKIPVIEASPGGPHD